MRGTDTRGHGLVCVNLISSEESLSRHRHTATASSMLTFFKVSRLRRQKEMDDGAVTKLETGVSWVVFENLWKTQILSVSEGGHSKSLGGRVGEGLEQLKPNGFLGVWSSSTLGMRRRDSDDVG